MRINFVGVEVKYKNQHYPVILYAANIPELLKVTLSESHIEIGSAVTLAKIETCFRKFIKALPGYFIIFSFYKMLIRFFCLHILTTKILIRLSLFILNNYAN